LDKELLKIHFQTESVDRFIELFM